MVIIYGKPSCGFCTKAKNFCTDRQLEFTYKDVQNESFMTELRDLYPDARSVPQIFIGSDRIGGYNELVTYVEDTCYNGTGLTL